MKREHRVTIRLTDTGFSIIENTAEQADMNISEYMRRQIMEWQVNTKFEIVADVKEIKKSLRDIYEMKYEVMRMAGDFRFVLGSDPIKQNTGPATNKSRGIVNEIILFNKENARPWYFEDIVSCIYAM